MLSDIVSKCGHHLTVMFVESKTGSELTIMMLLSHMFALTEILK